MSHLRGTRVAVIGAGLAGSLAGIYLAREGATVEVYERHGDLRTEPVPGPSMNLGLSRRGIESLARLGLDRDVLSRAIPMWGRVVHPLGGNVLHQPYGRNIHEVIHAIKRLDINRLLLDALDDETRVDVRFHHRCLDVDRERARATLRNERTGERIEVESDFLVGADGVFSKVRRRMHRGLPADFHREFLDWGWKELTIPPGPDGSFRLRKNAFHLWPRGGSMLFAHPNLDGSFTCSLVLPLEGRRSFAALASPEQIQGFFRQEFPDLLDLVPDLVEQCQNNPVIHLVSIRTWPWHHRDRVVLVGDAAHAVVPFMAQGMNAAFEDCGLLIDAIRRHGNDREQAFSEYARQRRPDTDALADMSKQNFLELRDRVRSPRVQLQKKVDVTLSRLLPGRWMNLHAWVTNTTVPYARARRRYRWQNWFLSFFLGAVSLLLAWWVKRD